MSQPILQSRLPFYPWMDPRTARLPGILPVEGEDWLRVDEAFAAQMAERDARIASQEADVHALLPEAEVAAQELLAAVLHKIADLGGYQISADQVIRPDGVCVELDRARPLRTAGRLVQEDLCLLQHDGQEHRLTGAFLCFPASWTLAQKIGHPMTTIHVPVTPYTPDVAKRVQRLFDAIRPEQALWRMNWLLYDEFALFQPRLEGVERPRPVENLYIRCERQCLKRLPQSRAVVFSIHTYLLRVADLPPEARQTLLEAAH